MTPSDIKVTLLIVLAGEDLTVHELLLTGAYEIIKEAPGALDAEFCTFSPGQVSLKAQESGYVYVLYRVDSPAYPHPLYFASTDGRKASPGDSVTVLPD